MPELPSPNALFPSGIVIRRLLWLTVLLLFGFVPPVTAQNLNGLSHAVYSFEWNASSFEVSGFHGQAFPPLTLYENNYYAFENNSSGGIRLSIGDDNQSAYAKPDVWNNHALGDGEYLALSPEANSSRFLYYFNPDQNATTGQLSILPYDSHLIHPDLSLDDARFGHAVLVNDWNQTLVGAPGQSSLDGAVYLFDREGNGSLTQVQTLAPTVVDGQFGASMASDGGFLAVGAPDEMSFQGRTYLYKRESNGSYSLWEGHAPPHALAGDSFGWGIELEGSALVVASIQRASGGSGKVSYYQKNPDDTWSFVSSFSADDNQSGDEFGHDLALSGNLLLVGAPQADGPGSNSGAAYLYELNGSTWTQAQKLAPSSLSVDDKFGYSVALSSNLAFVGAVNGDSNTSNTGCVYVFENTLAGWLEVAKISPPQKVADQLFASNLEAYEDMLLVGAPQQGEDGFGYLYRKDGSSSSWKLISSLDCKAAASSNKDHAAFALRNGMVVVGSPGDGTVQSFGGGALVFYNDGWKATSEPPWRPIISGSTSQSVNFTEVEDQNYSVTYMFDLNGSHPFSSQLSWLVIDQNVTGGEALFDLNASTGALAYRPDANYSGTHGFSISLSQGAQSDVVQLDVVVDGTPDRPVFSNPSQFVLPDAMEGDDYNQTIVLFDADGDAMILSLTGGNLPSNCTISGNSITGAPAIGAAGGGASQTYQFDLTVSDGSLSSVQAFQLKVLERNEPPLIDVNGSTLVRDLYLTIPEDCDQAAWLALLPPLSYSDPDGHQVDLNASVPPSHGTLALDVNATGNQSVLYTPSADYNGSDAFTIRLIDVQGAMNKYVELNFHLTITPVNDPPVITSVPSGQQASEGNLYSYQLLVYDPDQGDSVSISYSNLPGWLSFNPATFVFSGAPSWSDYEESGPRLVLVEATDLAGSKDSQAFLLEVVPANYPPRIAQGDSIAVQINEDSNYSDWPDIGLSATDQDGVLGQLNWILDTAPAHGSVNLSGSGFSPGVLQYKPDANYTGQDSFVIRVRDSGDVNAQDSIEVQVSVLPLDDAPIFTSSTTGIAVKDYPFEYNATVYDADGNQSLTVSVLSPLPSWVSFVDEGNGSARFTGTPTEYDEGQNLIVLEGRDSTNLFALQVFTLKVITENSNPIITQGSSVGFTATEDVKWVGDGLLSASDPDGQDLSWALSIEPSHGSAVAEGHGGTIQRLEYVPDGNFSGTDSFEVSVSDGVGVSKVTVTLDVRNVDDPPVFSTFPSGQSIVDGNLLNLSFAGYDADGLAGASVVAIKPTWLTLDSSALSSIGAITLKGTPVYTDEGVHLITVTLTDATGLSVSSSFSVTVEVLNYPPSINGTQFSVQMTEDLANTWTAPGLSADDNETPTGSLTWNVTQGPLRGTASFTNANDPSSLVYLPDGNFSGQDSLQVTVTDGGGLLASAPKSDSAMVNVEVLAVNDLPVFTSAPTTDLNDGTYSWNDESEYVYKVVSYDSDWDWQTLDLNVTSVLPSWLTFVQEGNGTGTLRGTGAVKDKGTYQIEFTATDSQGTFATQVFNLILRIDNYPPVFKSVSTGDEITQLIVYIDEDSKPGDSRGWVAPEDFYGQDPDPGLQNPPRDLEWSLGFFPSSAATAEVNGTGLRPQVFSYSNAPDYFGEDSFQLKAFDGHRYAFLPVNIVVRPVPDDPVFSSQVPSIIQGKTGSSLQVALETSDADGDKRKIEVVGLPQGPGGFWLGISDLNESSGTAFLKGTPPNGIQGRRYPIALIVTDATGRYSTANSLLVIDGENRSPFIQGPEKVTFTFDSSGNAKSVDLASILATDFDGDSMIWSLSPSSKHKYGLPKVAGTGSRPTSLTYESYGSGAADSFIIRVSDGLGFDELEVVPILVSSHDSIQVELLKSHNKVDAGTDYSSYLSLSGLSDNTVIDASFASAPSWLKITKISRDLFQLHGFVPKGSSGIFDVQVVFKEAEVQRAYDNFTLEVTSVALPTLSLKGGSLVRIKPGSSFQEPGYVATSSGGQDLSASVVVTGQVDPFLAGLQRIEYVVTDPTGSTASVTRFVQVAETNSSVVVDSLSRLDPRDARGILPLANQALIWGRGKNGAQESNPNSFAFLSVVDETGNSVQAQFFQSLSGQEVEIGGCISTEDGSFLVAGTYQGTLLYRDRRLMAKGESNLFLVKLDSSLGFLWSKTLACTGTLDKPRLGRFGDGTLVLGGAFSGSLDTEIGKYVSLAEKDLFLGRINELSGSISWLKRFGGSGDDSLRALAVSANYAYLGGVVKKTGYEEYSFVFELDKDGVAVSSLGLKGMHKNEVVDLAVSTDAIYALGSFEGSLISGDATLSSAGSSPYVLSLQPGLTQKWALAMSTGSEPQALETDAFGYPVVLNRFTGNFNGEDGSLVFASAGREDLALQKLNQEDGAVLWSKHLGGDGNESSPDLRTDANGKVFTLLKTDAALVLDGLDSSGGTLLLATVGSSPGPSFHAPLQLNLTKDLSFYNRINATVPSGFARMELVGAPSWVSLKDDLNGSAILGGAASADANASSVFKVRALDMDGGYADLNVSLSISDNLNAETLSDSFPAFSTSIDLGSTVVVSDVFPCEGGKYMVTGKFSGSLAVGQLTVQSQSGYDGFAIKLNAKGEPESILQLVSSDWIDLVGGVTASDENVHLVGSFSGKLSSGFLEIQSAGKKDLFVLTLSRTGDLLDLQAIGGVDDEFATGVACSSGKLLLGGYFEGSFSHSQVSSQAAGGRDGFVMSVSSLNLMEVNWFIPLSGSQDDYVRALTVGSDGSVYFAGSFWGTSSSSGAQVTSRGLSDAVIGKITNTGQLNYLRSGGGVGKDEAGFLDLAADGRLVFGGTFSETFQWDSHKVTALGGQDALVGALSREGNCLSLVQLGGSGTEQIRDVVATRRSVLAIGNFNGSVQIGSKVIESAGGRDSFVALFEDNLQSVVESAGFGGSGDDLLLGASSAFADNYLIAGNSRLRLGADLSSVAVGQSTVPVSFLCVYGSSEFLPKVWPPPPSSVERSSFFEYEFSSGPWPSDADPELTVKSLPSWLRVSLKSDGTGVVWGKVPDTLDQNQSAFSVDFSISSSRYGSADLYFAVTLIAVEDAFSLLSDSVGESAKQFEKFSITVNVTGSKPQDVIIYESSLPSWATGVRLDDKRYLIEGIPGSGHAGANSIKLFAASSSHETSFELDLMVESTIKDSSSDTQFGNWKQSWFGFLVLFDNSWAFHGDLGWIFVESNQAGNAIWFWTERWGWLWTDQGHWNSATSEGFLYSYKTGNWIYFRKGKPNLAYLYETGEWGYYENQ